MAALIEAIDIKRKMYFEFEDAPYHCLDVEISTPTARGGQTLVRAQDAEPADAGRLRQDLQGRRQVQGARPRRWSPASFLYSDGDGFHFMDQETYETLTLNADMIGDDRILLVENLIVQIQKYNGNPIGLQFPPHVELTVTYTEPGIRGDTASGSVTKAATLETGMEIRVPLFIKEGEKVKVHTETREFAGRA